MLLCGHQAGLQRLKRNSASCPFLVRGLGGFRLAHEYSCRSKPLNLRCRLLRLGFWRRLEGFPFWACSCQVILQTLMSPSQLKSEHRRGAGNGLARWTFAPQTLNPEALNDSKNPQRSKTRLLKTSFFKSQSKVLGSL